MQKVSRSIFSGLLVLAGLTACGDKITTNTTPTTTTATPGVHGVVVSPSSVPLAIGDSVTLVATVTADAGVARTVTWATTNSSRASVSATGLVKALTAGTVVITATSTADPTQSGAATIIVGATTVATISIASINVTTPAGSVPANLAAVLGQLDVTLNVDQGTQTVTKLDLIVGRAPLADTIVASYAFTGNALGSAASASNAPIALSFNTAAFTAASGAVAFRNGVYTIKAKATIAGSSTQAPVSSTLNYTLANVDFLCVANALCPTAKLVGATAGTAATGLTWFGGAVTATVIPVIYTAGVFDSIVVVQADTGIAGAAVCLTAGCVPAPAASVAPKTIVGTATPAQLTATWATTGAGVNVGLLSTGTFGVNITSVYNNGAPGPSLGTILTPAAGIRVDNVAPMTPTKVGIRGVAPGPPFAGPFTTTWIKGTYAFGNATDYAAANGDSVPGSAVTNNVSSSGLAAVQVFAWPKATFVPLGVARASGATCSTTGGTLVATGSQLAQSAPDDSTTYNFRIIQKDVVGNVACVDLGGAVAVGFGVDLSLPVSVAYAAGSGLNLGAVVQAAGSNVGYNNTEFSPLLITGVDSISGFIATPVAITVNRVNAAVAGVAPAITNNCVVPASAANPCGAVSTTATLSLSNAPQGGSNLEGYYTFNANLIDKATNAFAVAPANFLTAIDRTFPSSVGGVAVPAALVGGTSISLTSNITDNLTLFATSGAIVYNTAPAPAVAGFAINYGGSVTGSPVFGTLNPSATATLTVPVFWSSLQQMTLTGAPTNPSVLPTGANVRGVDEANLSGGFQAAAGAVNLNPNTNIVTGKGNGSNVAVGTPQDGDWTVADFTNFGTGPAAATNICNAASVAACTVNPSTIVLTDSVVTPPAKGLPFTQVCWYYLNPKSAVVGVSPAVAPATVVAEYVQISCQSAAAVTAGVASNVWVYTSAAWDPPAGLGTAVAANIIAIGFGTNGHAAVTNPNVNITLTAN